MSDWQHPFVDVFRQFGVYDLAASAGKGQVSVVQDTEIGRKVIRLAGAISANNCVNVPDHSSKSLGLTGRYIYVQFNVSRGKYFTLHLDFSIKGRDLPVRFTVSNIYEHHKVVQNHLQIPYPKDAKERWTILILDVEYFLGNFGLLPHKLYTSFKDIHVLKSLQLCSTMSIRGIFTSAQLYDWDTMPKQMMFKLPKGAKWSDVYQIAYWSTQQVQPQIDKAPLKEVTSQIIENLNKVSAEVQQQQQQQQRPVALPQGKPAVLDDLVKKRDQQLQVKSIDAEDHPLQPYPIMRLERVVGFTVRNCPDIRWGRQSHSQATLVYAAGNIIVQCDLTEGKQTFLMGHSQPVACLDVSRDGQWIVSGQQGKNAVVRVWDFNTQECLSAFATPYKEIVCGSFSYDGKLLVTVGSDDHNREVIIVWGLQHVLSTRKPVLVAKQSANCNILSIRFSPVDNNRLVSCGHENIKFWRIKNGHLPGTAVVLNHNARNTTFAVFDFEYSYEDPTSLRFQDKVNRVFFGSKQGVIFQVGYHSMALEAVYRVHDQPISSLVVSAGFCVTGSKDQFLRVWPLDFSEFYIEAKHEGIITSLDVSLDGLQVACGTSTGGLGVLDISNHAYRTVVRSHTGRIMQAQVHPYDGFLVTLSEDCTIRVWDLLKQEQVYEFSFPAADGCTCLSCHPKSMQFAAGFKSGITRIFDIENTQILEEAHFHDCEIAHITYNPQGTYLLVSDVKSVYRLYDAQRNYQPVKTLEQFLVSRFNWGAFSVDSQMIATVGDSGTHINLWDGSSFALLLKIFAPHCTFKQLQWAHNNVELVCACEEAKIRIYGIERSPGAVHAYFMREQLHMHRGTINNFALSANLKYLFTVGRENFVKVWDYEFSIKGPGSNQVFIGHSEAVSNVCVYNDQMVITGGGEEGIFVWSFLGNTGKNDRMFNLQNFSMVHSQTFGAPKVPEQVQHQEIPYFNEPENLDEIDDEHPPSPDKLVPVQSLARAQQQQQSPLAYQQQSTAPKSSFKPTRLAQEFTPLVVEFAKAKMKRQSSRKRLAPSNFRSKEIPFVQYEVAKPRRFAQLSIDQLQTMIGYNSLCHNNLVWCQAEGWYAYGVQNYVVVEQLEKQRRQTIIELTFEVGVLQLDPMQQHLLAGSSHQIDDIAPIAVIDTQKLKHTKTLNFHTRGIQKLVFSGHYLISIGNMKECTVAIWDWPSGSLLASSYTLDKINDVQVSQFAFSKERIFEFCTVGRDQVYFWTFTKEKALEYYDVFLERNTENKQLEEITSVDYVWFRPDRPEQPVSHGSRSIPDSSFSRTQRTEETEFREESRHSIQLPGEQPPQQPKLETETNVVQAVVLGLKSGELIVMQYGEFKVLLRRQVTPGEINMVRINQAAGKLFILTTEPVLQWMDITKVVSLKGFLATGLQLNRIRLPTMPISIAFDPLLQQAIISYSNGNIQFMSVAEQYLVTLNSTAVSVTSLLATRDLFVTVEDKIVKVWSSSSYECLTEFTFSKSITSTLFDVQYKSLTLFFAGEIRVLSLDRLDIYETYLPTSKQPIEIISSAYGVYDGLPIRFALAQDGTLYTYEQLFKGQDFSVRLSQVLNFENVALVVPQGDKRIVLLVERDTGVVNTLYVDYNAERDIAIGFTLYDVADFKADPHGTTEDLDQEEQSRMLYQDVAMKTTALPSADFDGVYFAILDGLQYLYGRNYHKRQTVIQIRLNGLPLCLALTEATASAKVFVGVADTIEIIDPTETEPKQVVPIHLGFEVRQLSVQRKSTQVTAASESGLCIYNF